MPSTVCFGRVVAVRRYWVENVRKGGTPYAHIVGKWTYQAFVEHGGKQRTCSISRPFFAALRARGVPRWRDHVPGGSCLEPTK